MTTFVLASSPLVGPTGLEPLARALTALGRQAVLPAAPADPEAHVRAVVEFAGDGQIVLVAYSAAGPRAHLLASGLAPTAIVYLDARLPVDGWAPDDDERFATFLDALPVDDAGDLPPWTSWWPDGTLTELCPDRERRAVLVDSCPTVPRSMFSQPLPAPSFAGRSGYVLLSEAYRDQADAAREACWPVVEVDGATHLSPFVHPDPVAAAVRDVGDGLA